MIFTAGCGASLQSGYALPARDPTPGTSRPKPAGNPLSQAAKSVLTNKASSEKEWKMPPREWAMAKAQFAVIFGERFIRAMAA